MFLPAGHVNIPQWVQHTRLYCAGQKWPDTDLPRLEQLQLLSVQIYLERGAAVVLWGQDLQTLCSNSVCYLEYKCLYQFDL